MSVLVKNVKFNIFGFSVFLDGDPLRELEYKFEELAEFVVSKNQSSRDRV